MSLLSLDNLSQIIEDLNKELNYKISENKKEGMLTTEDNLLLLASDGEYHSIQFLGSCLWHSGIEKEIDKMEVKEEIDYNERKHLEPHLRRLVNHMLGLYQNVSL